MKFTPNIPPRMFVVNGGVVLSDYGKMELGPDEMITFVSQGGAHEFDVSKKSWGYYATPSLNKRLKHFDLKPLLVANEAGHYFLLLLEKGKEKELEAYLKAQDTRIIAKLDEDNDLRLISQTAGMNKCLCGLSQSQLIHTYLSPPKGETAFPRLKGHKYHRELWQCQNCAHIISVHNMNLDQLYLKEYVDSTYGDAAGLKNHFDRISTLPINRSDNKARAKRVDAYCRRMVPNPSKTLLDIGSGLAVFPYEMKQLGWEATAFDTDARQVQHAIKVAGVKGIHGNLMTIETLGKYGLITFNKVLEHVEDPVALLAKAAKYLETSGIIYIELPDGEMALSEGPEREEFFIDHPNVFSLTSANLLATKAGLKVMSMERFREPSTKFTICAFLKKA